MEAEEEGEGHRDICCPPCSPKATAATPLMSASPADPSPSLRAAAGSSSHDPSSQKERPPLRQQWSGSGMDDRRQHRPSTDSNVSSAKEQLSSSASQQQRLSHLPARQEETQQHHLPGRTSAQQLSSLPTSQRPQAEEQQAVPGSGGGVLRGLSSPVTNEGASSQWKKNMRRWMKGVVLYARCRPVLFFSFVFFSAAHVLLSVAFLRLFPCPLLLTWAQLSQSLFYAFVLGEAGDTFPVFRSLFPSTSRTLQRAYAAVAAGGAATPASTGTRLPAGGDAAAGSSAARDAGEATMENFWQHKSGLLLQLLLRLLPYSLGYCLLQYANNVLAAQVLHPLQLPIVSSLALAAHELLRSLCGRVGHKTPYVSRMRRYNSSNRGGDSFLECTPRNTTAPEAANTLSRNSRATVTGGLPRIAGGGEGGGGAASSGTATGETELTTAMTLSSPEQGRKKEACNAPLRSDASSSDEGPAERSSSWLFCSSAAGSWFALLCSRLVRLLSLLLLGGVPAVYLYCCPSSALFSGAAWLFLLASLMYRSWLLPKALHLPRTSSSKSFPAAGQQPLYPYSRFLTRSERATASSVAEPPLSSSPSLSLRSFSLGRSTSFLSPAAAAARASYFRPKEISLLQNLTGAVLLLLPGLFCGEQHYTTFPFRFLLSNRWDEWLAAGCWISLGTVAFLRKITSSSIMREAGAPIWKAAELLALACVGCCSCFIFGNPGPAAAACCFFVMMGRLLGLATTPLFPHHFHHHHHHHYGLLREQQQQPQQCTLPSFAATTSASQPAADSPVAHNSSSTDAAPLGHSGNDNKDAGPPALTEGNCGNESGSSSSSSGEGSNSSRSGSGPHGSSAPAGGDTSSCNSSSRTPDGRRDFAFSRSFSQLASRSFGIRSFGTRSFSGRYGSRDDMPQFSFLRSGGSTSFEMWTAEAAARAAAAELPSVRLLEEPDIFLRPPYRGPLIGRRFLPSASLGGYICAAPTRAGFAAAMTWDRSGTQALLAEDRVVSHRTFPARGVLAAIGEEEEEEEEEKAPPFAARPPAAETPSAAAAAADGAAIPPHKPEAAAAEAGREEEEPDEEEAAAAATRGYLMDIVRAYVSRTAFEDLLLLEQWGGTSGVAAAVGADLLQGLPDERRPEGAAAASSSEEEEEESTTEDEEAEAEEHSAAMLAAYAPPFLSSAAAAPPSQLHPKSTPSPAEPRLSHIAAAPPTTSAGPPPAAAGWPRDYPPPRRRPRRRLHKRPKVQPWRAATKATGGEAGEGAADEEPAEGAGAEEEKEETVLEHRRLYGVNRLPRRPLSSFFSLCMEAASDATLKVLMFCGLMSLVLALLFSKEPETEMIEGLAIWVAVLVVVLVTAGNDWMKEQQFALLSAVKEDKKCSVIRSGEAKQLSVFDLVVGDLLQLEAGDEIPADALLVQGRDVKVDESSLTGESDPIVKEPFLVCMHEASALQRQQEQQQQHDTPVMPLAPKKQPQRDSTQHRQQHEEEGESIAASTAAESVSLAAGPPTQATVLQDATHSSAPPCSPPSYSSAAESSADVSSAISLPPGSAGSGKPAESVDSTLVPSSPGAPSSLAAALLPFSFSSSSSVSAAVPPLSPGVSPTLLARHHAIPSPVLLSGTTLSTGSCTALVVAVGPYSQVGQTFQKLAFDPEPTPLQMKLNALAEDIGNFGLAAAIVAFVVLLVEFWLLFWLQPAHARAEMRAVDILHEHVEFFVTAITILVVAVPEGLPLAVTISLAYSISQMLRDQNYVRRLAACEIMGGANEICSDKTGTLTKNQMAVTVFWRGDCPTSSPKKIETSLLLDIPASAATAEGPEQEPAAGESSGEAAVTPTGARGAAAAVSPSGEDAAEREGRAGVSARGGKSSGTEERTAPGFRKEYTEPLLEADLSARTTARSTEAAATGRTAAAAPAAEAAKRNFTSDKSRRYVAWLQGERERQQQRKWLLLAEAIAVNSTAFLEKEQGQDLVAVGAPEQPAAGEQTSRSAEETEAAPSAAVRYKHVGSPTECALLAFSTFQCHWNYASLRRQLLGEEDRYLLERREFTSDRKMMTSIIRLGPEAVRLEHDFVREQQQDSEQQLRGSQQQSTQQAGESGTQQRPLQGATVGGVRVFVKGAAERVLRQCSRVLVSDSEQYDLTPALLSKIEESVINCMAARALRTICIAYKDMPADATPDRAPRQQQPEGATAEFPSALFTTTSTAAPAAPPPASSSDAADAPTDAAARDASGFDVFERDLVCLGIAGIEDPVREEVPGAVLQCQAAGIRVRMVTGDNLLTAAAIATQCNIYHEAAGGLAMLGSDFMRYIGGVVCQRCGTPVCNCATDSKTAEEEGRPLRVDVIKNLEAFQAIWQRLEVLARSQPTDKYALVCALQQLHRVVAVTGDGTNDAPALRKADVGFAMGLSGKEVAKQAADIVMLDDNFTCIVKAVRWGRSVYDNIRRFLQFQLTVNVVAVLLTVTCVAVEREAPLSAVQMLWINLIMDSFASLALATEPPTDALLRRKPHGRDSYLISKIMLASILSAACYQVVVILVLIFYGEKLLPETPWKFVSQQERLKLKFCEFSDGVPEHCVGRRMVSGRRYKVFSTEEDYKSEWMRELGPSRHKTFVFNTFVFMQIFNMIAARDVDDEGPSSSMLQLCTAMLRNKLGLSVWLFILLAQILMTELGGRVLGCHFDGLTPEQWSLSLLLAAIGLLWSRLPHAFPALAKVAPELGRREEMIETTHSLALELRGRTPNRINERLGLASYTFAKKYAKKARLMTLSRMQKRRQQQQARSGVPTSPLRGACATSALRVSGGLTGTSSRPHAFKEEERNSGWRKGRKSSEAEEH